MLYLSKVLENFAKFFSGYFFGAPGWLVWFECLSATLNVACRISPFRFVSFRYRFAHYRLPFCRVQSPTTFMLDQLHMPVICGAPARLLTLLGCGATSSSSSSSSNHDVLLIGTIRRRRRTTDKRLQMSVGWRHWSRVPLSLSFPVGYSAAVPGWRTDAVSRSFLQLFSSL